MMKPASVDRIQAIESSGNVYADFGFPNPEEWKAKSALSSQLWQAIKKRRLRMKQAADRLDLETSQLEELLEGNFQDYSLDDMMRFLVKLNMDVVIGGWPHGRGKSPASITVSAA
jgi:predicted XRE-type DNA-binding protein